MQAMQRLFCWKALASVLLTGVAVGAQVPNSNQNITPSYGPPQENGSSTSGRATPPAPSVLEPGVTVTGKPLHSEPPLPKLPGQEFMNCVNMNGAGGLWSLEDCERKMDLERLTVLRACVEGKSAPGRVIQACTESLTHEILPIYKRSFLYANRAQAYLALGYKQRALADCNAAIKSTYLLPHNEQFLTFASCASAYFTLGYKQRALDNFNAAIKSAPHNAALYYNRGIVFAAQGTFETALQDFDTALGFDAKFVPALRQRAKMYADQGNFAGALADYSEAIRLQPKAADLWRDRGELELGQHQYGSAVEDEAQAIRLDPKLASAYYLRSVALGDSGHRAEAVRDLRTAVALDPSLAAYVTITGKTVALRLPPL
jgi:tetratricopeptide (TPR) repeat protein